MSFHLSRRADDDTNIQEITGNIEQLKKAADSLQHISSAINQLSDLAKSKSSTAMSDASLLLIKEAFTCVVCKGMYKTCQYVPFPSVGLKGLSLQYNIPLNIPFFLFKFSRFNARACVFHLLPVSCWMPKLCGRVAEKCSPLSEMQNRRFPLQNTSA